MIEYVFTGYLGFMVLGGLVWAYDRDLGIETTA
jgi:hypothetical protein